MCYLYLQWEATLQQCEIKLTGPRRAILAINPVGRHATADFEKAPVSALQQVFGTVTVAGCWFHYAQAVVKRLTKIGLSWCIKTCRKSFVVCSAYRCCLYMYKLSVGITFAQRLLMTANTWKVWRSWSRTLTSNQQAFCRTRTLTNNVTESYHAALKRQMLVSHPNMFFSVYIDDDCI